MSIKQFSDSLISKYNIMESDFAEVYTAFFLFFTLPVTVASVERSFSKLKLIKDFKRNSISQPRLTISELAILSIEYEEASKMSLKYVILEFANMKA